MKRILLLLTLNLFVNIALAQNTNSKIIKKLKQNKSVQVQKNLIALKNVIVQKNLRTKNAVVRKEQRKNVQMQKNLLALRNVQMQKNLVANQTKKQFVVKIKKQIQANAQKEMLVVLKLVKNILIATKKIKVVALE